MLVEDTYNPSLEDLEKSFGIERVTKEFFEKYKALFLRLKASLLKIVKNDRDVKFEFEKIVSGDKKDLDTFCAEFFKKLIGQIVFLYFLQKKAGLEFKKIKQADSKTGAQVQKTL